MENEKIKVQDAGTDTAVVTQDGEAALQTGEKKNRLVRHMMWAVSLISLAIVLFGGGFCDIARIIMVRLLNITDGATVFLLQYLEFIGLIVLLFLYLLIFDRPILKSFGYKAKNGGQGNTFGKFGLGLLAGFGTNALCILIAWLHGDISLYAGRFNPVYMLLGLVCVCVQSGAEEFITRGYMMRAINDRYNIWIAIAFNSLFFGFLHIFNQGITAFAIVSIVLIGLALSLAAIYLKSIWFCVAFHTAWNYSQSLFFGLPNSGIVSEGSFLHLEAAKDSVFYSVPFGVESTVTALAVELIMIIVFAALLARKAKKGERVMTLEN